MKRKIRPFFETLNFAIKTSEKSDEAFLKNFDDTMQKSLYYIKNLIRNNYPNSLPTVDDVNALVMDDYSQIIDNTFQNDGIYSLAMRYITTKYLSLHRDKLAEVIQKVESIDYEKFADEESYSDDFEKNCILTVCNLKSRFKESNNDLYNLAPELFNHVQKLVEEKGKDAAFLTICNQFDGKRSNNYITLRQTIKSWYWCIYGIEGRTPEDGGKSPIKKMVDKYGAEDYIDLDNNIIRDSLKNELIYSILIMVSQLYRFGQIFQNMEHHNFMMNRFKLLGLIFKVPDNELPDDIKNKEILKYYNSKAMSFRMLMNKDNLKKLSIESLLQLNSFYNNRLAKVIEDYAKNLFIIENIDGVKRILSNFDKDELDMGLSLEDIGEDTLNILLEKYQVLLSPTKQSYAEFQKEKMDMLKRKDKDIGIKVAYVNNNEENERKHVIYNQNIFKENLKKYWKDEYESYFKKRIPNKSNSIIEDFSFVSRLYNAVHLIYRFKEDSIKSEYAYRYLAMVEGIKEYMNFGIVLNGEEKSKQILLASDPAIPQNENAKGSAELNFPNRLHINRKAFAEFWKAYTGSPLIRVYEGYEDFIVDETYITTQVLCPVDPLSVKFMKDLRKNQDKKNSVNSLNQNKGKKKNATPTMLEKCGDKISTITYYTEPMVRHLEELWGLRKIPERPVRMYNFDTDETFVLIPNGELKLQNEANMINNGDGRD